MVVSLLFWNSSSFFNMEQFWQENAEYLYDFTYTDTETNGKIW